MAPSVLVKENSNKERRAKVPWEVSEEKVGKGMRERERERERKVKNGMMMQIINTIDQVELQVSQKFKNLCDGIFNVGMNFHDERNFGLSPQRGIWKNGEEVEARDERKRWIETKLTKWGDCDCLGDEGWKGQMAKNWWTMKIPRT